MGKAYIFQKALTKEQVKALYDSERKKFRSDVIINRLGEVLCSGTYGGHLQGITADKGKAIYWSFTVALVKTGAEGNLLAKVSVPNHHCDLTFHDVKVYVALNPGQFNKEAGHATSSIYDNAAKKLKLVSKHSIPEVVHGAGGIDYHEGHFFVVGGLPKGHKANYVYEYDRDFKFLKKHTVKSGYTPMGIQTACFSQGYWWFGCYGKTPTLLKTDASFRLLGRYDFDCALGISRFPDNTFLIGRSLRGPGGRRQRGKALSAKMDRDKGLLIVDGKAEQEAEGDAAGRAP